MDSISHADECIHMAYVLEEIDSGHRFSLLFVWHLIPESGLGIDGVVHPCWNDTSVFYAS